MAIGVSIDTENSLQTRAAEAESASKIRIGRHGIRLAEALSQPSLAAVFGRRSRQSCLVNRVREAQNARLGNFFADSGGVPSFS